MKLFKAYRLLVLVALLTGCVVQTESLDACCEEVSEEISQEVQEAAQEVDQEVAQQDVQQAAEEEQARCQDTQGRTPCDLPGRSMLLMRRPGPQPEPY